MKSFRPTIVGGAVIIILQAATLGFVTNSVRPDKVPLVRKTLVETHRTASKADIFPVAKNKQPQVVKPEEKAAPSTLSPPEKMPLIPPKPQPAKSVSNVSLPTAKSKPEPSKPAQPKKAEALFTTLKDAKALLDSGQAIFLDARYSEDYNVEHVKEAMSLPAKDFESSYEAILGNVPKNMTIVTYCSDPECGTAVNLADALVEKGFTRVFILLEGLPGWKDSGYPTEGKQP